MPLGSSLLSLRAGGVRLINKVCLALGRRAAKGRDYSVMKRRMAQGNRYVPLNACRVLIDWGHQSRGPPAPLESVSERRIRNPTWMHENPPHLPPPLHKTLHWLPWKHWVD